MLTKKYLNIMSNIDIKLKEKYNNSSETKKEEIFARALKFNEEVWELNSELLAKYYKRRNWKFSEENLEWEFADVMWTLILLAMSLNIDMNKSLEMKLEKLINRWGI